MLSLISGQKSPEATPIVKGNSEAPSMQFISLLGASEQDGRGVPGARSFPGEFRPGANSLENSRTLLSMAPVQSTEQDRGFSSQFEFTTPPQTERVRDSQSYFYAAGMERSSTAPGDSTVQSDRQSQSLKDQQEIRTVEQERAKQDQIRQDRLQADQNRQNDLREAREKDRVKDLAEKQAEQKRIDKEEARQAQAEQRQAEESRKTDGQTEDAQKVAGGRSGEKSSETRTEETAEKVNPADEDSEAIQLRPDSGIIAGISGKVPDFKPVAENGDAEQSGESQRSAALLDAIMKKALSEKGTSGLEGGEKSTGLWEKLSALDSGAAKELKEKIQAHPEFEKALKAMREGKDLDSFINRIVEGMDKGDLKSLKEMAQSAFRNMGEQTLAGNVNTVRHSVDGKWTVDGPVLGAEMRVKTDEKSSMGQQGQGKGNEGQSQARSDSQNLNFRMDSVATADAKSKMAAEARDSAPFDRKQFQQMVEQARVRMGPDGRSTAQIRMNPENLGRMHLDLVMKDNVISGRLIVENQQAFKMIQEDIENLRQELARHGIQLENLSVKTRESLQSQLQQDNRQSMQFQQENLEKGNSGERDSNTPSGNEENTEKYDSAEPNWQERSLSEVSETLLTVQGAGRIDLSV